MKDIKDLTKSELKKEIEGAEQQINEIGCFGMSDLMYREKLYNEVARRNLKISRSEKIKLINA